MTRCIKSFCITSDEEVGGVRCAGPMSVAPSSKLLPFLFYGGGNGPKGFSMMEMA